MPLLDHFEALATSLDTAPFSLILLGLDAASRAAALGWLCGQDFHVLSIEVPGSVGLVEVQLAERGYVLVKSGFRQEFDRLEPFLEAVLAADLIRRGDADAWLEPMHLEVAAPRGLQGLKLLMPESPVAIGQNTALLARLRSESNLLAVAGQARQELDETALGTIRDLAANAMASWAITCGSSLSMDAHGRGWTDELDGNRLPAIHIEPDTEPPPVPEFLRDSRSGVRGGLFMCQRATRFETALDMLEERVQQDFRQHEARRKMLMRRSANLAEFGRDRNLREVSEAIRRTLEDRQASIQAQLAESQRERLLPNSIANNKINNLLEDLTTDDISKETLGQIVQLGVAPRVRQEVRRLVGDIVRAELRTELEHLNVVIAAMTQEADAKINSAGGGSLAMRPETLDESTVWKPLQESIQLDSRYRGELAQKGLRERLFEFVMHCRTPVFLMTIVVSPLYSFAPGLREPLLKLTPFLFVGGAFWAYHGLKEEEHKAAERELIRLRDTLRSEIRRIYEQALGDWSKRAGQHLHRVVSAIGQRVDEHIKGCLADMDRETTRERVELQDKLKAVDDRLRDIGGTLREVKRVRQEAAEARTAFERATRDALRDIRETAKVT